MMVTYADYLAIRPRYCNKGGRKFCADNSLSWQDFKTIGLDEQVLLALDDDMTNKLVDFARKRRGSR